jgi:hypothetical protein
LYFPWNYKVLKINLAEFSKFGVGRTNREHRMKQGNAALPVLCHQPSSNRLGICDAQYHTFLAFLGKKYKKYGTTCSSENGQMGLVRSGAEAEEDREEDESSHDGYSSNIDSGVEHYESDDNGSNEFRQ